MKQPLGERRRAKHADGNASGRLPEDRDTSWVAAETGDMRPAIMVIARNMLVVFRAQAGVREKTERPKPVCDRDENHSLLRQLIAV